MILTLICEVLILFRVEKVVRSMFGLLKITISIYVGNKEVAGATGFYNRDA
jgi:hypothetical protein